MELNEILRQFERTPGKFPQAAVDEAVARREEITPALLKILEETVERPAKLDDNYMAHQFAMYLLGQFRETKACPWVLRIAALPSEHLTRLLGNVVNEDLGRILATLSGGDATGIQALVENEAAHYSARVAALDGLVTMVAMQQKSREEILEYFGELLRSKLKRDPDEYLWGALVCSVCDLYPAELVDEIERAYDDELVYPGYVQFEDVERQLAVGKESTLSDLAKNPHYRMIVDASDEMRGWACGHDDPPPQVPEYKAFVPEPVKHAAPKVGRNDPCPCGSGKKYKKCHGA